MMDSKLYDLETRILKSQKGKFVNISSKEESDAIIERTAKELYPNLSGEDLASIMADIYNLDPVQDLINVATIEDIMVNNTESIFVYDNKDGQKKLDVKVRNKAELERLVDKLKLYATNEIIDGKMLDVHLPEGSRANIVASPLGYDITIRTFKREALSILDLINAGELDYQIAARLWVYVDGFKVRPANLLIGGMPASGKTTLLNAMFSFFHPEARIVTIEETYELNTKTQQNCVRLETSEDMPMEELVKNALRMRPDMIVIGEVRGAEANDMITAMNIGKICMGTIHASSSRDIINRLQHSPMNVPRDIIPVVDSLMILSQVYEKGKPERKVVQISEISGIETQVLLSDLYKFDYKTHKAAPILASVTYRDTICGLLGIPPPTLLEEEQVRANILYALNKKGMRDLSSINETVRDYYEAPQATLKRLGLDKFEPAITV